MCCVIKGGEIDVTCVYAECGDLMFCLTLNLQSRGRGAGLSLSDNFVVVGTCGSGFPKGEECLNLLYGGVALL